MKLMAILITLGMAVPAAGQIDSKAIDQIQKWVDSSKGRKMYRKAGEIVMPRLTKSTKFGYLTFDEKTEDIGRQYYWKPKQSGKDVKMVGYRNWETRKVWEKFRINGEIVERVVDTRDFPGEFKTGEVHLIRNAIVANIRDDLECKIYRVVKGSEYKAIGLWTDIKERLRPPKSKKELEEDRKRQKRLREIERQEREEKKKAAAEAREKRKADSEAGDG